MEDEPAGAGHGNYQECRQGESPPFHCPGGKSAPGFFPGEKSAPFQKVKRGGILFKNHGARISYGE
jgi:hypothetical protein